MSRRLPRRSPRSLSLRSWAAAGSALPGHREPTRLPGGRRPGSHPHRRRRHLSQPDLLEVVRRLRQGDRRADQLPVHRLGRRHPPVHRGHGGFRRHRRPDDRRADRRRARATCCTSPRCSARWSSPTTCPPSATSRSGSTAPTLADIFLGRITRWNDPRLAALNPGRRRCPRRTSSSCTARTAPARATSSPTTCPRCRPTGRPRSASATSVNWPVGLGGKGNEGVTQQVKQSEGSIGYVELIYAISNGLPAAEMQERGRAVRASRRSRAVTPRPRAARPSARHRLPGIDHQRARAPRPIRSPRSPGCWSTPRTRPIGQAAARSGRSWPGCSSRRRSAWRPTSTTPRFRSR